MTIPRSAPLVATVAAAAILLVGCTRTDGQPSSPAPDAATEEPATACDGTIGSETVAGDLVVPRGASCRLEGTAVDGRVSVESGGSLVTVSAYFGEGIGAHSFRRIEILSGRVDGRGRNWAHGYADGASARQRDYVFEDGRTLVIRDGDGNGSYHVHGTRGRVEIVGIDLDLGSIFCAGNARRPVVRGISAETPLTLQGQCAGRRGFGDTDF